MASKKSTAKSTRPRTGRQIRQAFLDYFAEMGHTVVPSSSLVPGGDQTLLFTNAGMVQFKDVFLGQDQRPYRRAATAQRCMRVSGKHNDLDNVGPSPRHHTFFEMLGNFSFGEYFKRQAIHYGYDCLTMVFGLDPERMYFTVHESDDESLHVWLDGIGVSPERLVRMGDKTNFWQMADTGPCGPTAEIHYDIAPERGPVPHSELAYQLDVNPDDRFLELWNLVFMQFNQTADGTRLPLPAPGVDTGMGMERLTMIIQGVDNSYDTDLFTPILDRIQTLAHHSDSDRIRLLIPYRVIADHARAATFLIGDGVVPGNTGRNYVTRMVIRRASRFGGKLGFDEPFLAEVAKTVIEEYGDICPEIVRNQAAILRTLTDEERRFQRTVDTGVGHLMDRLHVLKRSGTHVLPGEESFDLYATYGLPFELTRDIAREQGADTDEAGFQRAMEAHRLASGAGQAMGDLGGEDVDIYREILSDLQADGALGSEGVVCDPYGELETSGPVLALIRDGARVGSAHVGETVGIIVPRTGFYVESGGQISDAGTIASLAQPGWEVAVDEVRRPAAGVVVHIGRVLHGEPHLGNDSVVTVDRIRRWDIMRNHTATHLLHASLRVVLGEHVRQAGSLVAADRLRFDFTHPEAMTAAELELVERRVNEEILGNLPLDIQAKPRQEAIDEGAMALFGETYGETVRTVSIGGVQRISYELCGGTHVPETGVIGPFLILSEGSVASGIRRIEAVTGRGALSAMQSRLRTLGRLAARLGVGPEGVEDRVASLLDEREALARQAAALRDQRALAAYEGLRPQEVAGVVVVAGLIPDTEADALRRLADRFRADHPSGVAVLASAPEGKPVLIAAVSQDLVARGLHAGNLVKEVAKLVGGGGGGKAEMAQAGGKDASRLPEALAQVPEWVRTHLR
jgi:alanyl-tRNA synthetase